MGSSEEDEGEMQNEEGAEEPPILPVEPIVGDPNAPVSLSYASSGNTQPPDSRFIGDVRPDGVILTLPALRFQGWRIMTFGLIFALLGAMLFSDGKGGLSGEARTVTEIGIAFILFGALSISAGLWQGTQPLVIEASLEGISIARPLQWPRRMKWKRGVIRDITISGGPITLGVKPYARILLIKRHSLPVVIVAGPRDECLWIAYTVKRALRLGQPNEQIPGS